MKLHTLVLSGLGICAPLMAAALQTDLAISSPPAQETLPPIAQATDTGTPVVEKIAAKIPTLEKIIEEGRFTAAVQMDFKPFSFTKDDGQQVGFEIDMMREFARRWLGDENAVTLLPVGS